MLDMAHRKYGHLPWAKLFELAGTIWPRTAFPPREFAGTIARVLQMARMPDIKRYFYHPDGTSRCAKARPSRIRIAATLQSARRSDPRAFYTGDIARAIVEAVQHAPQNQGGMTLADLAGYKAVERPPVCGEYREWHLCSMGPPSSGGVAIVQIMGMLQHFPSSDLQPGTLSGAHLYLEASRLAYADRVKFMADTDFVRVPLAGLTDRDYIAGRAALIDPAKDMGTAQAGNPPRNTRPMRYPQVVSPVLHGTSQGRPSASRWRSQQGDHLGRVRSGGAQIMAKGFLLDNTLTQDFAAAGA